MTERTPQFDMSFFKSRREEMAKAIGTDAALILPSHPNFIRNNDVHHSYRQDSNLFYATGFEEPESIFILRPGKTPETIMFVLPKDVVRETWDGFRYGIEGTKQHFNIDEVYEIDEFKNVLPDLLQDVGKVYFKQNYYSHVDSIFQMALDTLRERFDRSGKGLPAIFDTTEMMGELRVKKTDYELDQMRKACEISAKAHLEVMKAIKPGMNERALHGLFIKSIMEQGASREGYGTIVASGNSANTLHYVFNDQPCNDGDLLLIDAGAEYHYYSGDITRTYPVNGKFTGVQKRIYQRLLDIQKEICNMVKPGESKKSLQDRALDLLVDLMIDEKLLKGEKENIIETGQYRKFYPHGIGHFLGMDVHDAGLNYTEGSPRLLEPGMVMTIEPGIYIPKSTENIPDELRGIGIRIEDNLVITETGHENMTSGVPKEVNELEDIIGKS